MTIEQTTNDTTTTKRKKPTAKVAKRIKELEQMVEVTVAGTNDEDTLASLRAKIIRLENGKPEEEVAAEPVTPVSCPSCEAEHANPHRIFHTLSCATCDHAWPNPHFGVSADAAVTAPAPESAETAAPVAADPEAVTWADAVAASKEVEENRVVTEVCHDKILVDLTPEERAELGAEHVAADEELAALVDEKKEVFSDFKEKISKVERRKAEIAESITRKKKWQVPGPDGWVCEETFSTNTRRYLDPNTGRVMCTEPIPHEKRQLGLPLAKPIVPVETPAATAAAPQMSLGDVEPNDDTAMTNPEALLAGARDEEDPADAPLDNDGDDSVDEEDEEADEDEDEGDL